MTSLIFPMFVFALYVIGPVMLRITSTLFLKRKTKPICRESLVLQVRRIIDGAGDVLGLKTKQKTRRSI